MMDMKKIGQAILVSMTMWMFLRWIQRQLDPKRKKLPPTPTTYSSIPFGLGHLYQLSSNYDHAFGVYEQWVKEAKSLTVYTEIGADAGMLVLDPQDIGHFLAKNWTNYEKGPRFIHAFDALLGNGIFNSNGAMWKTHREAARPHFQRMELNQMVPVIAKHAEELISRFEKHCDAGDVFDIQNYFFKFTLDSAGEILFGANIDSISDEENKFAKAFDKVQGQTALHSVLYGMWKYGFLPDDGFTPAIKYLDSYVDGIVAKAFQDSRLKEREDLLAQYIRSQLTTEPKEAGKNQNYDTLYLRNMLKNMMIAGRDTTACLLTWMVYELSQHPEVEEAIMKELMSLGLDQPGVVPTAQQLQDCKYLKHVINETLRLHPSVPIDLRTSVNEDYLPSGYYVPPGCDMIYCAYLTHRLKKYWGEDAEEFDPSRWEQDRICKVPSFAFVAFHAGPRICLGQNMAYEESKLAIILLLQRYRFTVVNPEKIDYRNAIVLVARNGMPVRLSRKNASVV